MKIAPARRFARIALFPAMVLSAGLLVFSSCGDMRGPAYLDWSAISHIELAPPPAEDSTDDKADLATLEYWQANRTKEQCSQASAESEIQFRALFSQFKPFGMPVPGAVKTLFGRANRDGESAVMFFKERYHRPRPFLRDRALAPCIPLAYGFAYPSGHAAASRLFARLLGNLNPKCADAYLRRSDEIALHRVLGGVHHPSDIEAGKALADAVYGLLLKTQCSSATSKPPARTYIRTADRQNKTPPLAGFRHCG